ncbi:MAG: carbohydrate kinase family protein [Planctomycetes bacterium]|nr:carbohydrate kinase family protein [Planctomycetota bacterium]
MNAPESDDARARPGPLLLWGDVGFDDYASGETLLGGCALNVARAALSHEPSFEVLVAAPLGEDGEALREALVACGAGVNLLETHPGLTPRQPIQVSAEGERTLSGYQAGVLGEVRPVSPALTTALASAGLIYVPVFAQTIAWARAAWESGAPVALDLQDLEELPEGFLSEAAERSVLLFAGLSKSHPRLDELRALARGSDATWIVTLGAEGALAWRGGEETAIPATTVPGGRVVDTTGCGDTFAGTFIVCWREALSVGGSLNAASEAAARVASQLGT